jgi:hypothetical protein
MKIKIIIVFLFFLTVWDGRAQNLISNPSFEKDFNPLGVPNVGAQFQSGVLTGPGCPSWTADQTRETFNAGTLSESKDFVHSPDWFDHRSGFFRTTTLSNNTFAPVTPRTGNKFVGMFCGELIEQNLSTSLTPCKRYKASFFVKLVDGLSVGGNNTVSTIPTIAPIGTSVRVLLSPNKIEYKNTDPTIPACSAQWMEKKSNQIMQFEVKMPLRYLENWTEFSVEFSAASLMNINWIAFETNCCETSMLFIDDVSLEEVNPVTCANCTTDDGAINPIFANNPMSNGESPFSSNYFTIKNIANVKHANVKFFSNLLGQGGPFLSVSNPGCELKWDGRDNSGNFVPAGLYTLDIELLNNCTCWRGTQKVVIVYNHPDIHSTFINPSYPSKINPLVSCCRQSIVLEPQTFDVSTCLSLEKNFQNSSPQRHLQGSAAFPLNFKARDNIIIRNVSLQGPMTFKATNTIDIQGNDVTFSGAPITFIAKEVKVLSGVFRSGTDIKIEISPPDCPVQLMANNGDTEVSARQDYNNEPDPLATPTVSPNPTKGLVEINLDDFFDTSQSAIELFVYNLQGAVVFKKSNLLNRNLSIDLSEHSSGIYLFQIKNNTTTHSFKIVKE